MRTSKARRRRSPWPKRGSETLRARKNFRLIRRSLLLGPLHPLAGSKAPPRWPQITELRRAKSRDRYRGDRRTCQQDTNQKYPQYCWEFHDQPWEALSGTTSEKRSAPSRTGGEIILEMLWKPQMPWIIGFGASQPYSRREFQETLWERFRGLSGVFPEFLPEGASRTGGMAQLKST